MRSFSAEGRGPCEALTGYPLSQSLAAAGRRILGELQRAEVGDDGPAILDIDVMIGPHLALAVGDGVEDFAVGHLAIFIEVNAGHAHQAVLRGDAVARSGGSVAHLAVDLVTLLAPREQFFVHGHGNPGAPHVAHLAADEVGLVRGHVERDGAVRGNPIYPALGEKRGRSLGFVFRLAIHVGKNFDWRPLGEVAPKSGNGEDCQANRAKNGEKGANESLHA
jgi:hypothetical protein